MFRFSVFFLTLTLSFLSNSESAKILCIFTVPSKSHQRVFQPLTLELARRGHEVIAITPFSAFRNGQTEERVTEIIINTGTPSIATKYFEKLEAKILFEDFVAFQKLDEENILNLLQYIKTALGNFGRDYFDLIFLESSVRQLLAFSHIFSAPVIRISSGGAFLNDYPEIGASTHPFLYPSAVQQNIHNLKLWEKYSELFKYCEREFVMISKLVTLENKQMRAIFGQDIPSITKLIDNVEMLFVQTHPLWEGNVPVPPNVVHIWGIHLKPENNLPMDIQHILDSSIRGVIYMSFGSTVKSSWIPKKTIQAITRALSRVSYEVFLKWEEDILPEQPKNVHIRKWWPQEDLLRHPKVKLFISHGGLLSTHEAIVGGVPVISIPFYGDQFFNAEKCVHHKIGVKIELGSISEDKFYNAINTVIEDQNYRHNIIKLMMDQPQSALDRAVWWTEYVLRHSGARHLRSPAANISWAQYYEMELCLFIVCIVVMMLFLIGLAFYVCFFNFLKSFGSVSMKLLRKSLKLVR